MSRFDMIRDMAAADPVKADELARTVQLPVRVLPLGEVGTLTGVASDGWALVALPGQQHPHHLPWDALAEEGLCRVEMWEVVDGRPDDAPRLLGTTTWERLHDDVRRRGGRRRNNLFDFPAGDRVVRYRATPIASEEGL
ncbi:hypothetical protein Ade02nite_20870 [Paractinoplanes deccanensis]|uniref:Uncharacterized protein n=1 Tax=Paractinoplanes deccanensis TaxID=113561 RepID=A0ABQ3Y0C3_9ACTN|nr:hypothetical protein [Actinoplanes deccanensis]GID73446.1 hypothetical protein Ade02nite_20870 [Actinoplanes deccanensis]